MPHYGSLRTAAGVSGERNKTMPMRLDKYLADSGEYSRREASALIRRGSVTVDGEPCSDPSRKVAEGVSEIAVDGAVLPYVRFRYVMLNKPAGTVCTTDGDSRSVMNLLPETFSKIGAFPCGRLDADTVGLLIVTNDGMTAHSLLSPKKHCEKTYRFRCLPIGDEERERLENGIELSDFTSKPCTVRLFSPEEGEITVTEGKYHQIKRMFLAVGSEITYLERIRFAGIELDPGLGRGEWRELTARETALLITR